MHANLPRTDTDDRGGGRSRTVAAPDRSAALLLFDGAADAEHRVAGLPAAARIVRELALAGYTDIAVVLGPDSAVHAATRREVERLAPGARVGYWSSWALAGRLATIPDRRVDIFHGGFLIEAAAIRRWHAEGGVWSLDDGPVAVATTAGNWRSPPPRGPRFAAPDAAVLPIAGAGDELLRRTAKPSDGIISRWLNRPVSRFLSRIMLAIPGARPGHATLLTALTALAMFAALLFGGARGLVAGGILFHLASVLDGVDGEMARVTFRSSRRGAALDTGVDMATNLLFIAGVTLNLALAGRMVLAAEGALALVSLAAGILLLGFVVRRSGRGPSFNILKDKVNGRLSSGVAAAAGRILVFATSRDFFAFFFMVMLILGLEAVAVPMFATSTLLWLLFVAGSAPFALGLFRRSPRRAQNERGPNERGLATPGSETIAGGHSSVAQR